MLTYGNINTMSGSSPNIKFNLIGG